MKKCSKEEKRIWGEVKKVSGGLSSKRERIELYKLGTKAKRAVEIGRAIGTNLARA